MWEKQANRKVGSQILAQFFVENDLINYLQDFFQVFWEIGPRGPFNERGPNSV